MLLFSLSTCCITPFWSLLPWWSLFCMFFSFFFLLFLLLDLVHSLDSHSLYSSLVFINLLWPVLNLLVQYVLLSVGRIDCGSQVATVNRSRICRPAERDPFFRSISPCNKIQKPVRPLISLLQPHPVRKPTSAIPTLFFTATGLTGSDKQLIFGN